MRTLELILTRTERANAYTEGEISIDGGKICDTIEDVDRGLTSEMSEEKVTSIKVYGQTAIPTGRYRLRLDIVSEKFRTRPWAQFCKGRLPRLEGVKGFKGILIHVGNTSADSLGCILVGKKAGVDRIVQSTATFRELYDQHLLPAFKAGREIYLTIV